MYQSWLLSLNGFCLVLIMDRERRLLWGNPACFILFIWIFPSILSLVLPPVQTERKGVSFEWGLFSHVGRRKKWGGWNIGFWLFFISRAVIGMLSGGRKLCGSALPARSEQSAHGMEWIGLFSQCPGFGAVCGWVVLVTWRDRGNLQSWRF